MPTPVRKVVTRSRKTMRAKYPSAKAGRRTIETESLLEKDTLRYLEISPWVTAIYAQPSVEIYYDTNGEPRRYIPDFEVHLIDGSVVHIEVKPESKLHNPEVKAKLEAVARRYEELSRHFRVLTEEDVRREPLRSNLQVLSYHSRSKIDASVLKNMEHKLQRSTFRTVAEAAEALGGTQHVYRLIATGFLGTDFNLALAPSSHIWLTNGEVSSDSLCI